MPRYQNMRNGAVIDISSELNSPAWRPLGVSVQGEEDTRRESSQARQDDSSDSASGQGLSADGTKPAAKEATDQKPTGKKPATRKGAK